MHLYVCVLLSHRAKEESSTHTHTHTELSNSDFIHHYYTRPSLSEICYHAMDRSVCVFVCVCVSLEKNDVNGDAVPS